MLIQCIIYTLHTRADTGGGIGDCPPPEQFQGGDCPPPENCPPPEQFRGGQPKCPPLSDSGGERICSGGGGQKIFRALCARFVPPLS